MEYVLGLLCPELAFRNRGIESCGRPRRVGGAGDMNFCLNLFDGAPSYGIARFCAATTRFLSDANDRWLLDPSGLHIAIWYHTRGIPRVEMVGDAPGQAVGRSRLIPFAARSTLASPTTECARACIPRRILVTHSAKNQHAPRPERNPAKIHLAL
jgi:hypothetical protein